MKYQILFALFSTVVTANYASDCDPLKSSCPADPALAKSIYVDFKSESEYFTPLAGQDLISYSSEGLTESWKNHGDAPALKSNFYILYGKIEFSAQTANGIGLISNVFLQSDDGDEIDIEWVSGNKKQVQTNYFSKGITGNYDRGKTADLSFDTTSGYHTYVLEWKEDETVWTVDGNVVRTLKKSEVKGGSAYDYPNSPSRVFIGLWSGGDSKDAGTASWAGGPTKLDGAPFKFNVKYLKVSDYSTGTEYKYSDNTGNKFEAVNGGVNAKSGLALTNDVSGESVSSSSSTSITTSTSSTSTFSETTSATDAAAAAIGSSDVAAAASTSSIVSSADVAAAASTSETSSSISDYTSDLLSSATSQEAGYTAAAAAASESSVDGEGLDDLTETSVSEEISTYTASATTVIDGHTTGVSYGVTTSDGQVNTYTTSYIPLTSTHTNTHFVTVRRHRKSSSSFAIYNSTTGAGSIFEGAAPSISSQFKVMTIAGLSLFGAVFFL